MPTDLTSTNPPTDRQSSTALSTTAEAVENDIEDQPDETPESDAAYDGIDWTRLPQYQLPHRHLKRSPSWIWKFGYRVQERKAAGKTFWVCHHCHQHHHQDGIFDVTLSTSSATRHLAKSITGHSVDKNGPITLASRKRTHTVMEQLQARHDIPQSVANQLLRVYKPDNFRLKIIKWIAARHHPLREVEIPEFQEMIAAINPDAVQDIFKSHQILRQHILDLYKRHEGVVFEHLQRAQSLVHITFDGWTTRSQRHALTGIGVHYLADDNKLHDYILSIPEQIGRHTGYNYADTLGEIIARYNLSSNIGYFTCDNAKNNTKCLEYLSKELDFDRLARRLRCSPHTLNLVAQRILFGRDKESFENDISNLTDEEKFLKEWQQEGPIGTLLDLLLWINTTQRIQQFEQYQIEENNMLSDPDFKVLQVIKPIKTRWNSYQDAFERAIQLKGPLDAFAQYHIDQHNHEAARCKARGRKPPEPPLFIRTGGMTSYDWDVIRNYVQMLRPFKEATKRLEGRGVSGRHGAIWEVIPVMDVLLKTLEDIKERFVDATTTQYPDQEPMEDHYAININRGWAKLSEYFSKLDESPAYYAAVVLHPHLKRYCANSWKDQPDWLCSCDTSFQKLWLTYKTRPINHSPQPPPVQRRRLDSDIFDAILSLTGTADFVGDGNDGKDEYERWKEIKPVPHDHPAALDPIKWWSLQRAEFPHLSQMALDILTIPASSADCEVAFSELGDLLEPRRSRLHTDIIAALQCLRSWGREGFISW